MAWSTDELVQRGHNFAIVDEVDSILIDEARTPLIISGPADQPTKWYVEFARWSRPSAASRAGDGDYEVDEKKRTVGVLEAGIDQGRGLPRHRQPLRVASTPRWSATSTTPSRPRSCSSGTRTTSSSNGEVLIVDEHTGRMLAGRRYNEGMHQAIEAKEGVEIKNENQTLATITLQNYFRHLRQALRHDRHGADRGRRVQHDLQAGRRADPDEPADDPRATRPTSSTRTRRPSSTPSSRTSPSGTSRASRCWSAPPRSRRASTSPSCCAAAASRTRCSTPSTTSGRRRSSPRPAARAPSPWPPTWPAAAPTSCSAATPSSWPSPSCKQRGLDPEETPEEYEAAWAERRSRLPRRPVAAEHDEVTELGGLYVLGTERHESRRIDNQLRGRSGRQGDPGETPVLPLAAATT